VGCVESGSVHGKEITNREDERRGEFRISFEPASDSVVFLPSFLPPGEIDL
jgi:hypothetical protein